ncbi:hypothetical protein [Thermobrachium celere]|uniref:Uncharacterized protein n=1 Tax=Thermobrachium celere DSM 8682 TaxID=941824 RepID=R7RSF7_9CLOT|nr:hypothetical protein [Thermobrachium celere]GFR35802.1 hypothetical protein TCEA9_16140 [Thermobrachium celere]CDF58321.1 hypothetical protein TCEL_00367 [Thermobrachium celere DSM 8682]
MYLFKNLKKKGEYFIVKKNNKQEPKEVFIYELFNRRGEYKLSLSLYKVGDVSYRGGDGYKILFK